MKLSKQKENILNQEEPVYLTDFLNRLDMTYINSGMKDVVNLGKSNGFSQYEKKLNLLWSLREYYQKKPSETRNSNALA